MRSGIIWLSALVLCMGFLAGCGEKGPTAEDTAFEKQLADAAGKNAKPSKPKGKRTPPENPGAAGTNSTSSPPPGGPQ
jgi:predicted small lipoprotein YifL